MKNSVVGVTDYIGGHMVKRLGQLGWQPQFPDLETIVAHAWA